MIQLDLSAKMLRFTIEALEFRIAAYRAEAASGVLDDDALADIGNDTALLNALLADLKRHDAAFANAPAPPGDPHARNRLRLIMQCLRTEGFSEAEQDALIAMGRAASPDPAWTDYLYWPDRHGLDGSVEAALDKAFSYCPIVLPGGKTPST